MLAVELVPLGLVVLLFLLPLSLLLLSLHRKLLKLVPIHLHVSPDHAVSNRCDSGVPVLVLAAVQEAFYDDRVSLRHVALDKLLHHF